MNSASLWPKLHPQFDDRQLTKIIYGTSNVHFSPLCDNIKNKLFNLLQSNHVRAELQKL